MSKLTNQSNSTQDTEDVVARLAKAIHADRQRQGLSGEAAWEYEPSNIREIYLSNARAALEASDRQSLSDRIDVLEGGIREALRKINHHNVSVDGMDQDIADAYKALRAALRQEATAP